MVFRGTKLVLTHIHAAKLGEKKKQLQQIQSLSRRDSTVAYNIINFTCYAIFTTYITTMVYYISVDFSSTVYRQRERKTLVCRGHKKETNIKKYESSKKKIEKKPMGRIAKLNTQTLTRTLIRKIKHDNNNNNNKSPI